jgi:glycosyltransferase involved in cell wall biosynthesis
MSPVAQAKKRRFVLNGKFLSADSTGVHRVAEELFLGLQRRLRNDADLAAKLSLELWVPHNAEQRARVLGIPYKVVGPLAGIPWEQLTLPARAAGRTVVSLCNVGPIALRDAITMFHDAQVHSSPQSYSAGFRAWYRLHQPLAGRRHRKILTVSDYSRGELAKYGLADAARVDVVHNGVDHMLRVQSHLSTLRELQLEPARFVVGLANTQAHKNIALLLKAFAQPDLAEIKLVLFGGASTSDFEAMGHCVPSNVRFVGRISDEQLKALYENALCMAFPSLTEGFGLPPLEAMLVGCPAVVAPCGSLPEVCAGAAMYAAADDATAWVHAIRKLHDDPQWRAELKTLGQARAAQMTWDAAAGKLLEAMLSS